jgi:hypothetical protein
MGKTTKADWIWLAMLAFSLLMPLTLALYLPKPTTAPGTCWMLLGVALILYRRLVDGEF